ncbi:MAG: hypothetical protein BWY29_00901 [Microgenomates group bacterium ADurb.Bin238]|nr:MAG: hypothetical protein BWY29_00901 [Microgenomates group bacterium ADurb.Bin238]
MKNLDKKVIDRLKEQAKREAEYNNKFIEARREIKKREEAKLTHYQRFKKQQDKERKANEMLREFLEKKA